MNIAVIFAGGVGKRMKNHGAPKQFLNLFGDPIIVHTIRKFQDNPLIDQIIIVMLEKYIPYTQSLVNANHLDKVKKIVPGGKSGQESIFNGIDAAKKLFGLKDNIVLIHDGVRPYFEPDLIERCIASVKEYGSAISSAPATETTTQVKGDDILGTTDRSKTFLARAPQCFMLADIYAWHKKAREEKRDGIIDSCSMMLTYGDKAPHMVATCPENIKVTTPLDYYLMRAVIDAQDELTVPDSSITNLQV